MENENIEKKEKNVLNKQMIVHGTTACLQISKNVLIIVVGVILASKQKIGIGSLLAVRQLTIVK